MNSTDSAASAARTAQDSTVFRTLARVGYVVLGILHLLIGGIAVSIATGGGGEADQGGAMQQIQRSPAGVVLLWIIVLGLVALAIWQIAEAVLERDPDAKKKWGHRIKFLGTAAAYVAIAGTALVYALGGQSQSSDSSQSFSARLLAAPAGVALLVLVGLIVVAVGGAFVVRGITRAFTKHLELPTGAARKGIIAFGVVGYIAKGIAVGVSRHPVRGRRAHARSGDGRRSGCCAARAGGAPVRRHHPLDGRCRTRPLRPVLLRSGPIREDVRQRARLPGAHAGAPATLGACAVSSSSPSARRRSSRGMLAGDPVRRRRRRRPGRGDLHDDR